MTAADAKIEQNSGQLAALAYTGTTSFSLRGNNGDYNNINVKNTEISHSKTGI